MANDCTNKLIVVGLKEKPEEFAKSLELAVYGETLPRGEYYSVSAVGGTNPKFCFKTKWQPPAKALIRLSKNHKSVPLLLEYSCWESGFRGQMVIRNGEMIEYTHRGGYGCPTFLFADITHPLVDLFESYLEPQTLAQQAASRLQNAIATVRELKETLEDERFIGPPYRAACDWNRVNRARAALTVMCEAMIMHAAEISFDGVLVSSAMFEDC